MRRCGGCQKSREDKEFFIYNRPVDRCRACRKNASNLVGARKRRERDAARAKLEARARAKQAQDAARVAKAMRRAFLTRYSALVRPHNQRIKVLLAKPALTDRNRRSLAAQQALVLKYENAYKAQMVAFDAGLTPKDIHEYM